MYRDDCVEIFLDANRDSRTYHHLIVNSLGTVSDRYVDGSDGMADHSWNGI